jgi:hypothetical protein
MNALKLTGLLLLAAGCVLSGCGPSACALDAQATKPDAKPDTKQFVQQAVNDELAADRDDHSRWIYHEVDRKPNDTVVQWVGETGNGDVNRVISRNGQQIPEAEQRASIDKFIHDPAAQAKRRRSGQHDDEQAEALLRLLPVAFIWTETGSDEKTTTLHFKPDPNFRPPSREARVFSAMEGDMTVENSHHRIQELKGTMIRDVNFGWGVLGRLEKGGSFSVERRETGPGIWQITETHVHIQGHALIFKSISEQEDDEKSSFTSEPGDVTFEQAESAVMAKPDQ